MQNLQKELKLEELIWLKFLFMKCWKQELTKLYQTRMMDFNNN